MLGLGNLLSKGKVLGFPNKYSFNFDGSNDYLDCGFLDDFVVTNNISVSLWFNASGIQDFDCFFSQRVDANNILKAWYHGNNIVFEIYEGGTKAGRRISWTPDSNWHHLVFSFDTSDTIADSKVQIYLDGALPTQTDIGGYGNSGSTESFRIGSASNDNYFTGKIDEFAFWNAVLSASDVAKIGSKPVDLSKASTYDTDRTSNLKLWLRAGDKVLPESDASIARSDFYTDFDGSNDYVALANTLDIDLSETWSISCWFNTNATSAQFIFASTKGASSRVSLTAVSNIIQWTTWNGSSFTGKSGSALPNVWHHVVATLNNTTLALYINGVAQTGTSTGLPTSTVATLIGAKTDGSNTFSGQISNLSVYQTVLDAQTIKQFAKSRYTPMRDNRFSVVDFDGSNDYIAVPDNDSLDIGTGNVTVSAWVKPADLDANHAILDKRGSDQLGIQFMIHSGDRFFFQISDGTDDYYDYSGSLLTLGQWHHICAVWNPSTTYAKFYLDGVDVGRQFGSTNANVGNSDNTSELRLGRSSDGYTNNYFDGSISSVSMYNVEKSAKEIYALYSKGITYNESSESGLVGLWRMGDDTSKAYPTIADSSSNSNDGTITNGASDDIVQQAVAMYDMGAFESSSEELGGNYKYNEARNSTFTAGATDWTIFGGETSIDVTSGEYMQITFPPTGADYRARLSSGFFDGYSVGDVIKLSLDAKIVSGDISTLSIVDHASYAFGNHSFSLTSEFQTFTGYGVVTNTGFTKLRIQRSGGGSSETVIWQVKNIKLQKVLQSDLSDAYPAIIDVNEPVLGAELFTSISAGTNWSYDSSAETLTASGATTTSYTNVLSGVSEGDLVKLTFDVTGYTGGSVYISCGGGDQNTSNFINGSYELYLFSGSGTQKIAFDGGTAYTAVISNISVKEVSGNVGKMTNQATSDLVYSSVLPDQSFLTGVNSAYNFIDLDGGDQYIDAGALDSALVPPLSISMWVKGNSQSGATLIQDDAIGSGLLYTRAGNEISLYTTAGEKSYSYTLDNTWVNIVLTQASSAKPLVYVNGSLLSDGSQDNTPNPSFSNIRIGGDSTEFNGSIGQSAIWNKVLSSTEVGAIYTLGRHGNLLDSYSDNLKGYWAMSTLDALTGLSDSISTIYDRSGNSNHGTPQNADAGDLASSPNATPNGYSSGDTNRSTTKP